MRNARAWFGAAALAAMTALGGAAFADGLKVAVIDVNKVLNESEAGKDAKTIMERHNETICGVRSFWETNEDVYNGLLKLSATVGLPFDKNYCR